jgi:hypothetical protein
MRPRRSRSWVVHQLLVLRTPCYFCWSKKSSPSLSAIRLGERLPDLGKTRCFRELAVPLARAVNGQKQPSSALAGTCKLSRAVTHPWAGTLSRSINVGGSAAPSSTQPRTGRAHRTAQRSPRTRGSTTSRPGRTRGSQPRGRGRMRALPQGAPLSGRYRASRVVIDVGSRTPLQSAAGRSGACTSAP